MGLNRKFYDLFNLFGGSEISNVHRTLGFRLNMIAKTASPGPDVSVPSLGSMKTWQN